MLIVLLETTRFISLLIVFVFPEVKQLRGEGVNSISIKYSTAFINETSSSIYKDYVNHLPCDDMFVCY